MNDPLTIVLVAGEISGDNLGAPLMREIKLKFPDTKFAGIGGPAMIAEGLDSWFDINRLSINGFVDPVLRLPELLKIILTLRSRMLNSPPDCFVGIDFNFFNLLLEGLVKRHGIKTVHYVSPTVWAWRSGRIKGIKKNVDLMLTLYPFETAIYEQHEIGVKFVGHPKAHEIAKGEGKGNQMQARAQFGYGSDDPVVAILPGSRSSEVGYSGPDFFLAAQKISAEIPDVKFLVPAVNPARKAQIEKLIEALAPEIAVTVVDGQSRWVMTAADVVLVNSGTATLEAMLLNKPMVMSYRLGSLTYRFVSRLVKTKFFALPNILAGKKIVPEYIQDAATPDALADAVIELFDQEKRESLEAEFSVIHDQLRIDSGNEAADAIISLCEKNTVP